MRVSSLTKEANYLTKKAVYLHEDYYIFKTVIIFGIVFVLKYFHKRAITDINIR